MGLSPESPEDEAGIKRAAENSEQKLFFMTHMHSEYIISCT